MPMVRVSNGGSQDHARFIIYPTQFGGNWNLQVLVIDTETKETVTSAFAASWTVNFNGLEIYYNRNNQIYATLLDDNGSAYGYDTQTTITLAKGVRTAIRSFSGIYID